MKNLLEFTILLFLWTSSTMFLFSFNFIEAAKADSGVEIMEAAPTNETAADEVCNNGKEDVKGSIDEGCIPPPKAESTRAASCELVIESGAPINYGQLSIGQRSEDQSVIVKNIGTTNSKIIAKGGDWIDDVTGKSVASTKSTMIALRDITPFVILESSEFPLGELPGGAQVEILFRFNGGPNDVSGSLHQEITLDLDC